MNMSAQNQDHGLDKEEHLVQKIHASEDSDSFVETILRTDERVIARVTDGIYRRPGSALRELISNAYDADATRVVINTDAPRFEKITIEDNGHGMSPEVLAHMLFHIGGSAKRSRVGQSLRVTDSNNPYLSPCGRRLIGKIGIGLFSVSQLTHSFQVITKVKGDKFRTVAAIVLKQYADDEVEESTPGKKIFESGKVNIWREKATDTDSHGTTVVLTSIRRQAQDTLRSNDIWTVVDQAESLPDSGDVKSIDPPRYHIGRVASDEHLLKNPAPPVSSLPWDTRDNPDVAFEKLVKAVWDEIGQSSPNPQLDKIFDYYLRMVWELALAIPLPYVGGHLFDMAPKGWAHVFELSSPTKNLAEVEFAMGETIRERFKLTDPAQSVGVFDVFIDDLKLVRPIKFTDLPESKGALKEQLIFIGKRRETFENIPTELTGGTLAFEAYLFWTPKIAPTEHRGALVRIHGSSGTLFDSTFLRYQTAEIVRMNQIFCEIFVNQGLDSALNIDRESFNAAHPHSVYITKWLHSALRQLASAQKKLANEIREKNRGDHKEVVVSKIQRVAVDFWAKEAGDPDSKPPGIEILNSESNSKKQNDSYAFRRSALIPENNIVQTRNQREHEVFLLEKLKSIAQILASYGLLDAVSKSKQEALLRAIYQILEAVEE